MTNITLPRINYAEVQEYCEKNRTSFNETCAMVRAALAAPQGEPVAWMIDWPDEQDLGNYFAHEPVASGFGRSTPLYTAPQPAPQGEPVLAGRWHHGNGVLCSGSLRIARADFDTNPPLEMQERIFDDICEAMNRNLTTQQSAPTLEPPRGWKLVPVEPTVEMLEAGSGCWMMSDDNAAGYWNEMLSAAPQFDAAKLKGGA